MDILNDAIRQGIAPAIIVAIYLIIVKIIDNRKEKAQVKLNSELVNAITNISNFVNTITKNTIEKDKDKCKVAIKDSMNNAAYKLNKFVIDTLINNHIDINKDTILSNIKNITNAEYYNTYSTLSLYEINGIKVSEYLKKEWLEDIERDMIDSIYNSQFTIEDKIMNFSNKINIKFQSWATYIINNTTER